jgi:undecaprenyl pyrophosphate synthase
MDGNGRWAVSKGLSRFEGHVQGAKVVETIAQQCVDFVQFAELEKAQRRNRFPYVFVFEVS